jgi:hypothetical protein
MNNLAFYVKGVKKFYNIGPWKESASVLQLLLRRKQSSTTMMVETRSKKNTYARNAALKG